MNTAKLSKQKGIGLIEVLIALLVVSLGLLALANFQGNLLKTSGNNKAKAEAVGIAQQELELIRYAATKRDDFIVVPTNPTPKTVVGTNTSFLVTSLAEDPSTNSIINVVVNVSWTDASGEADNVILMSGISLQDIQKSAFATNDAATAVAVPSPRQSASEDVRPASENAGVNSPTPSTLPASGTAGSGDTPTGLASSFSVNDINDPSISYTLSPIAPDSRYYNTYFGDGNLAVYVCESVNTNGCRYIQNHFGGVSLSTSGKIYSFDDNIADANDLSGILPVWSSSEVTACYKGDVITPAESGNNYYELPYECVYAGNCQDEVDPNTVCQQGVTPDEVIANNVGPGGEFGNLGLIGLDGSNGGDQVCFLEDTPSSTLLLDPLLENVLNGKYAGVGSNKQYNENYLFPVTTRTYVTRRLMSNGQERSEGINKSFRNHNFLLVDRANNAETYKNCYEAVQIEPSVFVLAPRQVVRVRTDIPATNPVESAATFSGLMPAITIRGASSNNINKPNIYIPEVGSCYVRNDNFSYACVIPDTTPSPPSATLYGMSSQTPAPTTDASTPALPAVYDTCDLIVDTSQLYNKSVSTPCNWSAGSGFN